MRLCVTIMIILVFFGQGKRGKFLSLPWKLVKHVTSKHHLNWIYICRFWKWAAWHVELSTMLSVFLSRIIFQPKLFAVRWSLCRTSCGPGSSPALAEASRRGGAGRGGAGWGDSGPRLRGAQSGVRHQPPAAPRGQLPLLLLGQERQVHLLGQPVQPVLPDLGHLHLRGLRGRMTSRQTSQSPLPWPTSPKPPSPLGDYQERELGGGQESRECGGGGHRQRYPHLRGTRWII